MGSIVLTGTKYCALLKKKKEKERKKVRPWSWEDHTALSRNCSDEVSPISIQKLL